MTTAQRNTFGIVQANLTHPHLSHDLSLPFQSALHFALHLALNLAAHALTTSSVFNRAQLNAW
jgi:hypothetical protein